VDATTLAGCAGSALIAVSLSMTHLRRLRWINLAGAATFAGYGAAVGAWPVALLNSYVALADVWHLVRMSRRREWFSTLELPPRPSPFLARFLEHHRADLAAHFPDFDPAGVGTWRGLWILRDLLPVGLFVHDEPVGGEARVRLDYVVPTHRDLKSARWLLGEGCAALRAAGVERLVAETRVPVHRRYLLKLGFVADGERPGRFSRELPAA